MGDSDSGHDVAVEVVAAERGEARSALSAAPDAATALAGLAAPGGPSRGGGAMLARHALTLQRTAGNAATRRLLARQPKVDDATRYRVVPPGGSAANVAGWTARRVGAVAGRDIVAVLTAGQLLLFSADPSPRLLDACKRGPDDAYHLFPSVWWYGEVSGTGRIFYYLITEGTPRHDGWTSPVPGQSPEGLVDDADKAKVTAMVPPAPGRFFVAISDANVTTDKEDDLEIVVVAGDDSGWAMEAVRKAKAAIDKAGGKAPDKIVPWRRKSDGKWFVNVWVGTPSKGGEAMHHRPVELTKGEATGDLAKRIGDAASELRSSLDPTSHVAVKGGAKGGVSFTGKAAPGEISLPAGVEVKPVGDEKVNWPAFPARLVSHGPEGSAGNGQFEQTVVGATVNFTMDLDYAAGTSDFWEEFGNRWQVIDYRWEIIEITNAQLDLIKGKLAGPTDADLRGQIARMRAAAKTDPDGKKADAQIDALEKELATHHDAPDSGAGRDIARDLGNTWDDTKADVKDAWWTLLLGPVGSAYFGVVAISDLVQVGGALLGAGVSELAKPMSDRSIGFGREGIFLIRCFAQPVITKDDIARITAKGMAARIRAPSVAYLPVKVVPIHTRARQVNDAELDQIKALEDAVKQPPFPYTEAEMSDRLKAAKEGLNENNEEAVDRAIKAANEEIARIDLWSSLQGKQPLGERDPALRVWKSMLDLSGVELDGYRKDLNASIGGLKEMKTRLAWHKESIDGKPFRPRITLVSELDGRAYPIVANLGPSPSSKPDSREWHLVDVTSENSRHDYVGRGDTNAEAIKAAIQAFAENNPYGRGTIAVRLPPDPRLKFTAAGEDLTMPALWVSAPGFEERAFKRLRDLATAAEIAGLFISGPLGAGLMVVGGVAGGLVALHNMQRRAEADRLKLVDFETAMDIVAVAGAVLAVGGAVAKGVQTAAEAAEMATLARRGRQVAGAIHVMGIGMLAGQVVIIPATTVVQLQKIADEEKADDEAALKAGDPKRVDHAKYRARRMEAIAGALRSIVTTARMVQLGADPSKGWDPFAEPMPNGPPPTAAAIKAGPAAAGLPPDLLGKVPVEVDPKLGNSSTVKVFYDFDPATGTVRNVRMRIGEGASATDVGLHVETARALLRYSGLSGRVRALWDQLMRLLGSEEPPAGSRAWEARIELKKFPDIIKDRVAQLADPKLTEQRRAELLEELAYHEEQVAEHAQTVADMNLEKGRGYVAAKGKPKPKPTSTSSSTGGKPTPKATGPPAPKRPAPPPPPPGPPARIVGVRDPRTAATGGITSMREIINPFNEVETVIEGRLLTGMNRKTAPNYNRDGVWGDLRALHPELQLSDWEAAHLWGPGFGDEAAAGMMLAPKDVNQVWQNRGVEKFLRELRGIAGDQGLIVRVRAVARSHPRTFAGGMGDSLMQSVQYDFTLEAPGQSPRPYGQVSFSVGTPPGGVVSEPVVIQF